MTKVDDPPIRSASLHTYQWMLYTGGLELICLQVPMKNTRDDFMEDNRALYHVGPT